MFPVGGEALVAPQHRFRRTADTAGCIDAQGERYLRLSVGLVRSDLPMDSGACEVRAAPFKRHIRDVPRGQPRSGDRRAIRRSIPIPSRGLLRIFASLTILATVVTSATPLRAQQAEPLLGPKTGQPKPLSVFEPSNDDLLILELQINRLVLSEGLIAYQIPSGVCLYLGEVARALDFPIEVDLERGRAEGWFLRKDRIFVLDLVRDEVTIADETGVFDVERLQLHPGGICVELTLFSAWFPIDFELDISNAIVNLISREPLPIEQRLARERRRAGLLRGRDQMPDYPQVEIPYQLWSWPIVDTFVDARLAKDGEDENAEHIGRYNVLAVGDLLRMSGELFLSGDTKDALSRVRARLGRKDSHGGLLGPLDAREFTLGDISTPQTPLVARSRPGRGIEVSSFPLDQPEEFDRITLRGELPLGWEVELYRNRVLLEFQVSRDDGRYEFDDVPVLFGRNELRLVFYGPQGQIREETEDIFIGPNLVRPDEGYFRVAVNQQDRDLITVTEDNGNLEVQGEARFVAQYERGIADGWSIGGGLFSLPFDSLRRNYLSLGLRTAMESFTTRLDIAADDEGGATGEISAQGFLGPLNLFARHAQFSDFISERAEASGDDTLTSRSVVRADSVLPIGERFHLPISIQAKHERRESGLNQIALSNRLSTAYRSLLVTNDLRFDLRSGGGADSSKTANGSFLLNYRLPPVILRGEVTYELHPETEPTNVSLTTDWDIARDFSARANISHRMRGGLTEFTVGLNKRFEFLALGANLGASSEHTYFAGLSITLSLGRDAWSHSWRASPSHMAQRGRVAARVFVDENRDGRFDKGDRPLEGVDFLTNRRRAKIHTDKDGTAIIDDLPVYRDVNISVALGSIEDPYLVPAVNGYRIPTRPGALAMVEVPLLRTGEVDGSVFLDREGEVDGIADIRLELLNEKGEVIQITRTEFDGFYLFELVPLGRYMVQVSPEQPSRLSLEGSRQQQAVLTADEPVVSGVDFTISRIIRRTEEAALGATSQPSQQATSELPEAQSRHADLLPGYLAAPLH